MPTHTNTKKRLTLGIIAILILGAVIALLVYSKTPSESTPNKYIALTQAYLHLTNAHNHAHHDNHEHHKHHDNHAHHEHSHHAQSNAQNQQNAHQNADESAHEDALALIQRAKASGYELIDAHTLAHDLNSFVIIATLPRGIYNLGLIPGAKHFGFAKSPSLQEVGKTPQDQWAQDALNRSQQEFVEFLGAQKDAKIVFYDEGDDIFAPVGSAHTALLWAQNLGYTNLYRLVGGFGAWKALSNTTSTQKPHCCEME